MNLRARRFEKRLWAEVKEHDLRRRMSFWRRLLLVFQCPIQAPGWVGRTILSVLVIIGLISNRRYVAADAEPWMAAMSVWGLVVAQTNAIMILRSGATDAQYRTTWFLPLTADEIYSRMLRRAGLGSAWLFAEFLVLYGLAGVPWTVSLVCAAVQMAVASALVAVMAGFRLASERRQMIGLFFALVVGIILVTGSQGLRHVTVKVLNIAHPFGWTHGIYVDGMTWWRFIGLMGLLALVPPAFQRLRRLNAEGLLRELRSPRAAWARVEKPGSQAAIEKNAQRPVEWTDAGFVERLLAHLLTPQERIVAEMLLIERPQWSGMFYSLLVYTVLFLAANSFIRLQSADEMLRAAILNFDRTAIVAIVGCLACLILFSSMFLRGISLFWWQASPEWLTIRSKDKTLNPFFTFRLFPVSYWEAVKVITKVNSALFLLLLPLVTIVSQSPVFQMFGHRNTLVILPKCLTLVWAATVLVSSLKLNPCTEGWRYWRALTAVVMMGSAFCGFVGAFMMSPNVVGDIVLIIFLVVLTLGWVTY